MLRTLEGKVKADPTVYTNVALMIDAMAIRQQLVYAPSLKRMLGTVDLGIPGENEDGELAKEALVFMIVGLKGHWKAPVAYYLTNTLSSSTQKELILHCIEALHAIGMNVRTITMDGHPTNLGMCRQLGCNFNIDSLNPSFVHPLTDQTVYVILDACHMVKLCRNMLQTCGAFLSDKGRIEWNHLVSLHHLQDSTGLMLGNRLTDRHISFQKQKMKVKLAVQALSSSVASALRFLEETGLPEFENTAPTVEYIEVNDILYEYVCK